MKRIIVLFLILGSLLISNIAYCIIVDGYAFLYNQSNHSGIKALFERTVPSILTDSTYTDSNGYYSIDIETGIYNVTYSKEDYHSIYLFDEILYSNTSFPDFSLTEIPGILNVPFPYHSIQFAIDESYSGDTILVDPGVYYETINFLGKDITVSSLFLTTGDTTYISQTVIDAFQSGSTVNFFYSESYTTILTGFTITNGSNGIYCNNTSPTITNLSICNNSAGGIRCINNSNPYISNVTVFNNSNSSYGGGISMNESNPILTNVNISNNSSDNHGGGVSCNDSNPILTNVTISNNSADWYGGGIFCTNDANPSITNCIISNNMGNFGIVVGSYCFATINYSDFYNNQGGNFEGCEQWVGVNVTTNANGDSCDAYYNIQLNPLFVDPNNGDYHLTEDSPCIDAGDPNSPLDPDGTIADMGAFYYNQDVDIDNYELTTTKFYINNYPNPFNPITIISFSITNDSNVELSIYNIKGQKVKSITNENYPRGSHQVVWNGVDDSGKFVSSALYMYKLNVNGKTEAIKKCLLLK